MKRTAIIAAMLLLGAASAGAQSRWNIDTTCLSLWFNAERYPGYNALYNPDLVMVDTCTSSDYRVWIHRGIRMVLPIEVTLGPPDTIIEVSWTSIDTSYPKYRTAFQKIYDSVGPYILRKLYPSDTNGLWFEFRFFSYAPGDSVYPYLHEIPGLTALSDEPTAPGGGGGVAFQPMTEIIDENLVVYPCPTIDFAHIIAPPSLNEHLFTIMDEMGRVIGNVPERWESNNICTLDFSSNFSRGLYFVRFGPYTARIILENGR